MNSILQLVLQQVAQGHECVGQVRVRGWSTSFPHNSSSFRSSDSLGKMGQLHPHPVGRSHLTLLQLWQGSERGEEQGSGLVTSRKAIKMNGEERIDWNRDGK